MNKSLCFLFGVMLVSSCRYSGVEVSDAYGFVDPLFADSIFHEGMYVEIDFIDHSQKRRRYFSHIMRVGIDVDNREFVPVKSCALIGDSVVALSSELGGVRFLDVGTGKILNEFGSGMGPREFLKPQKIMSTREYVSIYDEHRSIIEIFDTNYNHISYIHVKNFSNTNTGRLNHQPAYGLNNLGVWIVNDVEFETPVIQRYSFTGELIESKNISDWLIGAPASLRKYGVWVSDKYIAVSTIGVPYVSVFDMNWNMVRFFSINHSSIHRQLEYLSDPNRNLIDFRSLYGIHFIDDVIVMNVFGILFYYDLSSGEDWGLVSAQRPADSLLATSKIVNKEFIATAGDTTAYYSASNYFSSSGYLVTCPVGRDFVDIFEVESAQ